MRLLAKGEISLATEGVLDERFIFTKLAQICIKQFPIVKCL